MRVIEITGIAGVGKSYVLEQLNKKNNIILDTTLLKKYKLNDFKLGLLFFQQKKSLTQLWLSIQIAHKLKMPFFHKLNFIRNVIKKFGKNYFITHRLEELKLILIVDEGISHIYQNLITTQDDNDETVVMLVHKLMRTIELNHEILIITAAYPTLFKRLFHRGHKRLNSTVEVEKFIKNSQEHIKQLEENFNHIIHITNEDHGDLEQEFNKIWKKNV